MKFTKLSMAYNLKQIKDMLTSQLSFRFVDRCAKIVENNDNRNINHWAKELYAFVSWIMKSTIKPNNKVIDKKLIMDYFFAPCTALESYKVCLNQYRTIKEDKNDYNKFNMYRQFCEEIALHLEKRDLDKFIMEELINKYLLKEF